MIPKRTLVLIVLLVLASSFVLAGRSQSLSANVAFADAIGDAIQSDGGDPYQDGDSYEGIPIKVRIDSSSGQLGFSTIESPKPQDEWVGRPIVYDFSQRVDDPPLTSPVPFPYFSTAVQWILTVKDPSGTEDWPGGLLAMSVTEELPANLTANFRYGDENALYSLRFHSNYVGSDQLSVTCTTADSDGCTTWSLLSTGNGKLLSDGSTVDEGIYSMPFQVTIELTQDSSGGGGKPGKGKNR